MQVYRGTFVDGLMHGKSKITSLKHPKLHYDFVYERGKLVSGQGTDSNGVAVVVRDGDIFKK